MSLPSALSYASLLGALLGLLGSCASRPPAAPAQAPAGAHPEQDHAGPDGHAGHQHQHGDAAAASHDHRAGMPHDFKGAEGWAKVFDDPSRDAWQRPDELVGLLALRSGQTVADVGAGTGYFVGRLAAQVGPDGAVLATDVEADMVQYLNERGRRDGWRNVKAYQVPPDDPQLPPGGVDRVLIVDVWHHLGDRRAYAAKLAAALRPGGAVVVVDFTADSTRGPPAKHRLAPEVILEELRSAGLVSELATETLPDQYVVIGRRPAP